MLDSQVDCDDVYENGIRCFLPFEEISHKSLMNLWISMEIKIVLIINNIQIYYIYKLMIIVII